MFRSQHGLAGEGYDDAKMSQPALCCEEAGWLERRDPTAERVQHPRAFPRLRYTVGEQTVAHLYPVGQETPCILTLASRRHTEVYRYL